jgi:hypothetical protein
MAQGRIVYVWQCRECPWTVWHLDPAVIAELAWQHQTTGDHRGRWTRHGTTWTRWTVWRGGLGTVPAAPRPRSLWFGTDVSRERRENHDTPDR